MIKDFPKATKILELSLNYSEIRNRLGKDKPLGRKRTKRSLVLQYCMYHNIVCLSEFVEELITYLYLQLASKFNLLSK